MVAVLAALLLLACSSDSKPTTQSSNPTSAASSAAPAPRPLRILVSNDDGVDAPGIDALVHALIAEPDVQNIGPAIDLSGTVGAARAAAQRGIPALAVSAGLGDPIDYATVVAEAVQWLRDHRAALLASAPPTVDNLNAPTCATGKVRGLATVTPDASVPLGDALAPADCTSTTAQPSTDVAAFHVGYATISSVPVNP